MEALESLGARVQTNRETDFKWVMSPWLCSSDLIQHSYPVMKPLSKVANKRFEYRVKWTTGEVDGF